MAGCAHTVPYLTSHDCQRCGATPEEMSPNPDRLRAEIDKAKAEKESL